MTCKCMICGRKAKRRCCTDDARVLCPSCCAAVRSNACEGCAHFRHAQRYAAESSKERRFTALLDSELDAACNDALAFAENGNPGEAEARLAELNRRHPRYHSLLYGLGVCAALQERYEEAAERFRSAVEAFPWFTEAYFNLGLACIKTRDLRGMVAAFSEVVRLGDREDLTAAAKDRLNTLESSIRECNGMSLKTFMQTMDVYDGAFGLLEKGDNKTCIRLFQQVLSADPRHKQSWGNLGLAYARMGQRAKAIECLNKALEIDPDYEVAAVNRAIVESLKDGEKLEGPFRSIDYEKDYGRESGRSYSLEVLRDFIA